MFFFSFICLHAQLAFGRAQSLNPGRAENAINLGSTNFCHTGACEAEAIASVEMSEEREVEALDVTLMQTQLSRNTKNLSQADGLAELRLDDRVSDPLHANLSLASQLSNSSSLRLQPASMSGKSLLPDVASSMLQKRLSNSSVWISAYARSGSSTLLAGVATAPSVFPLYEPHNAQTHEGKDQFLMRMFECDFISGDVLQADWEGAPRGIVNAAAERCKSADLVAVKTVVYGHDLRLEGLPLLEREPQLRIVSLVRDPRAIYSSQMTTPGDFIEAAQGIDGMLSICDVFAKNINVKHKRIEFIVFERMTTDAAGTLEDLFEFLGLEFGSATQEWIEQNFDADCGFWSRFYLGFCSVFGVSGCEAYTTCRSDAAASNEKWRYTLGDTELQAFQEHPSCVRVAEFYGYPTGVIHQAPPPYDTTKLLFMLFMYSVWMSIYVWASCCRVKQV
mmetsp:Transcript_27231/g.47651  ORF Transcript_27231/g.47651 Transcript_27231/m.47651 type:complete len:449 (-) Transcript_27231:32-1378(-)